MTDDDKGYQGWANYETWNVKLWLDNDEGSYRYWNDATQEAWATAGAMPALYTSQTQSDRARVQLAEQLKSEHEEQMPELPASMWADLLNAALSEVDWYEIADALLTTAAENDDAMTYEVRA